MRRVCFSLVVLGLAVGCDGSKDDGNVDGGGGSGGSNADAGAFGGSGGRRDGGVNRRDGGMVVRPDVPVPFATHILKGRQELVGAGLDACSNQVPATGDRWCAFATPGQQLGQTELWAFNLTKAIAPGYELKCDGTSPDCVRVFDKLWTEQPPDGPAYPFDHRFDGDTLIFHGEATSASDEPFAGKIYAWRPGWTMARQISGNTALTCVGHGRAAVAYCIENLSPDTAELFTFDLSAGVLSDTANTQLPVIDRIVPVRSNEVRKWRLSFTRDGQYVAWSTGKDDRDTETLYVSKTSETADKTKKTTIATDAARFVISLDGTKVYYLKEYNYSAEGDPSGTLMVNAFPAGGAETKVAERIGLVQLLVKNEVEQGIGFFRDVGANKGDYQVIYHSAPTTVVKIRDGISSALWSRDLRYFIFSTAFDEETGLTDARIVAVNGNQVGDACPLSTRTGTTFFGLPTTENSGMVFWVDNLNTTIFVGDGFSADPRDCSNKKRFAQNVDYWYPVGDKGLVYSDDGDGEVATLRSVTITSSGRDLGVPTVLQKQINRYFAVTLPDYDVSVFQLSGVGMKNGIYILKNPSLTGTPDGGATTPDAGAVQDAASTD